MSATRLGTWVSVGVTGCMLSSGMCIGCARSAATADERLRAAVACAIRVEERENWSLNYSGWADSLLAATATLERTIEALPPPQGKDQQLFGLVLRRFNSRATDQALAKKRTKELMDAGVPEYVHLARIYTHNVIDAQNAEIDAATKYVEARDELIAVELHVLGTEDFLHAWLARSAEPGTTYDNQLRGKHWADSVAAALERSLL